MFCSWKPTIWKHSISSRLANRDDKYYTCQLIGNIMLIWSKKLDQSIQRSMVRFVILLSGFQLMQHVDACFHWAFVVINYSYKLNLFLLLHNYFCWWIFPNYSIHESVPVMSNFCMFTIKLQKVLVSYHLSMHGNCSGTTECFLMKFGGTDVLCCDQIYSSFG